MLLNATMFKRVAVGLTTDARGAELHPRSSGKAALVDVAEQEKLRSPLFIAFIRESAHESNHQDGEDQEEGYDRSWIHICGMTDRIAIRDLWSGEELHHENASSSQASDISTRVQEAMHIQRSALRLFNHLSSS